MWTLKSYVLPRKRGYHTQFPKLSSDDNFLNLPFSPASQAWKMSTILRKTMCRAYRSPGSTRHPPAYLYRNIFPHLDTKPEFDVRTKFGAKCTNRADFLS